MCTGMGLAKPAFALLACEFEHPLANTIVHATVATHPNFTQGACMCIEIAASANLTRCCSPWGTWFADVEWPFDRRLEGEPEPPRYYRWNWKRVLIRHPSYGSTRGSLNSRRRKEIGLGHGSMCLNTRVFTLRSNWALSATIKARWLSAGGVQ